MSTNQGTASMELLRLLAARKYRWMLLSMIIFISSVFFFRYGVLDYSSTVTLMVVDGLKGDKNFSERTLPDYLLPSDQFNRLQQVVLSNSMFDHLIRKFSLYNHYGIDTAREFHYERTVSELRGNISLKKTPFNTIAVTVNDRYRYYAYEMANEIAAWSDTLNRKLLKGVQGKRLSMYRHIDRQLEERIGKKQRELERLLAQAEKKTVHDESLIQLRRSIISLQNVVEDHAADVKEQLFILETLDDRNFPTVVVQQKALPGASSLLLPAVCYSTLVVLLFLSGLVLIHHLILRFREHWNVIQGKE